MTLVIGRGSADRAAVRAFYQRELGREVDLGDEDLVVALVDGEVVGSLRVFPEAGTLVLRTVVVKHGLRGRGIGRALLSAADEVIGARECYCFPWDHLERFYGEIGFRRIPDDTVPPSLGHRLGTAGTIATRREGRA